MRKLSKCIALCMAACLGLSAVMPVSAGNNPFMDQEIQEGLPEGLDLEETFPDPVFRDHIAKYVDTDGNGSLSTQEIEQVTELPLSGMGIASLKGIQYFSGLQMLDCSDNQIGALDLEGLEHLYELDCTGNQISLSVNEAGQVDLSGIPDMDPGRILEISQGTWDKDGILQLPQGSGQEQVTYIYDTAGENAGQQGGSWKMEVTVGLEDPRTEEGEDALGSEEDVSENEAPGSSSQTEGTVSPGQDVEYGYENPNGTVGRKYAASAGVAARSNSAAIKSCKILANKTQVQIKASIPKQVKSKDKYYYLFISNPKSTKLPAKPAAKVAKKKTVTFTVPLNYDNKKNALQSKFQVAVKTGGKYKAISKEKYITNPEILASSTLPFIKGDSKKGLQFGQLEDAVDLGMNYCLFNLSIAELMQPSGSGQKYKYKGKNYDFNWARIEALGSLFSRLQDENINLSVEFLLPWVAGQTDLIHPAARSKGAHNYYAWNISTQSARNKYEALFSYLAEWFNGQNGHGYINNYLIGNEVNAFDQWHYTGSSSLKTNANLYADTYQVVYMAVKSKCKNARVSICLDHTWNTGTPGRLHSSKSFLDQFATRLKKYGSPNFTISYHAYPIPLTQADFWNNPSQYVKNSTSSPYITMKNIQYLTQYVKSKYGSKTRIMLTEQGFSSHGAGGEKKQAAAIAYAFYKAEFNGMIDCIIFRSQADAQEEIDSDNLHMGLWTVGMGKKKAAYNVFKYMDTPKCESYTKNARKYLKINKWTQLVPKYRVKRFKK